MKKTGERKKSWWIGLVTADLKSIDGIVLREFRYKESSKIIEVFTKELGRISIIANSVLKKNSKNLSLTARFTQANYNLYKSKGDFYGLKDGQLLKKYFKSNENFDIILYKSAIADLLLRTIDNTQIDTVYKLLINTFDAFDDAKDKYINIFLAFLIKYVSFSGYKPNFKTCGICGKNISGNKIYFSIKESSPVCDDCKKYAADKVYLSSSELLYFNKLLYTKSEDLASLELIENYQKIGRIIIDYSLYNLGIGRFSSMDWVLKALERNVNVL